eukprot:9486687-Pyramimonas_sp.AAC.1
MPPVGSTGPASHKRARLQCAERLCKFFQPILGPRGPRMLSLAQENIRFWSDLGVRFQVINLSFLSVARFVRFQLSQRPFNTHRRFCKIGDIMRVRVQ